MASDEARRTKRARTAVSYCGPTVRAERKITAISFSQVRSESWNGICRDDGTGAKETCGGDVDIEGAMARNLC